VFFPKIAQNIIADIFYDKNIYILEKTESIDDEGGVVKQEDASSSIKRSFNGNVKFNELGAFQNEMGLIEKIDISITCSTSVEIELDDLIKVGETIYQVTKVLPFDSHKLITGMKWRA
jgi:hypothetical protein